MLNQQNQQAQPNQSNQKQIELSPEAAQEFKRVQYLLDSVTQQRDSALNSLAQSNSDSHIILDELKKLDAEFKKFVEAHQKQIDELEKEKQDLKKEVQELKYKLANSTPILQQETTTLSGADNVSVE